MATKGARNNRLRIERRMRGWTQVDVVERMYKAAIDHKLPVPKGLDANYVSRYERGVNEPSAHHVHLLCLAFDLPSDRLGLPGDSAPAADPLPANVPEPIDDNADEAVELLALGEGNEVSGAAVAAIEAAALRLRRSYSRTPPVVLGPQIDTRLRAIRRLLRGNLRSEQRRDLMAAAGWLALLQSTVWFDRSDREQAWLYRDAALRVAQELGHAELEAWCWETPAWFALLDHQYRDTVEFSQAGQRIAPPTSSVYTAVYMQEARACGRLRERASAITAITEAQRSIDRLPIPEHLDDHYVFDPAKVDFYAATCFLWLHEPHRAEQHARQVIAASSDPNGGNYWPTRVGSARMDLGLALAQRRQFDAAAYEATLAFDSPFVRRSTLARGKELLAILTPHTDIVEVRTFRERLDRASSADGREAGEGPPGTPGSKLPAVDPSPADSP
jgi:transcriptional regulator with XRE-family HTH domain